MSHADPNVNNVKHLFRPASYYDYVLDDARLSTDEKRVILSSWASDMYVVETHPSLRQVPGIPHSLRLDDILAALKRLDDDPDPPPRAGLAMRLPRFSKVECTASALPPRVSGMQKPGVIRPRVREITYGGRARQMCGDIASSWAHSLPTLSAASWSGGSRRNCAIVPYRSSLWRETMFASFSDPFEALLTLQRALDARIASDWMEHGTAASGSFPPINIFQKGDDLVAVVELPGVEKSDLEIEAKENTVRIRGKKTIAYGEQASVHRRERVSGMFDRTLSVPIRIEPDHIKAEYRDGILALFIPRAEADKPRSIKVS